MILKQKALKASQKTNDFQKEYEKKTRHRKKFVFWLRIIIFAIFLLFWELSASFHLIDSFFFSSPSRIFLLLQSMICDHTLLFHLNYTLLEIGASFFLVIALSFLIAMLLWFCPLLSEILEPYLILLNSLPKSAMAPLFIVWLGTSPKTIIVAGISVAVFGSIISLFTGFSQTDEEKIRLIYTLGGKKKDVFFKIVFPSNIKTFFSTVKVDIGLSLVGVVIGEFLAARCGLGYLIIYGSEVFKMDLVIMSISLLCIIAVLLYFSICLMEKKLLKQ